MAIIAVQYLYLLPTNTNAQLLGMLCLAGICHVVLGRYQYGYWIAEPCQIAPSPFSESILNLLRSAHLFQQPVENRDTRTKDTASQDSLFTKEHPQ